MAKRRKAKTASPPRLDGEAPAAPDAIQIVDILTTVCPECGRDRKHRQPHKPGCQVTDTHTDMRVSGAGWVLRPARVARDEWRDPEDTDALTRTADGKRGQKTVKGYRVVDTVLNLHRRCPAEITLQHLKASIRLRNDYDIAYNCRGGRTPGDVSGGSGVGAIDNQIEAINELRKALIAVGGSLWGCLIPIVIHSWTVAQLADARRISPQRTQGYLVAALDRLSDHYWPEKGPATIRPTLSSMMDPGITDIPQERLGRSRQKVLRETCSAA